MNHLPSTSFILKAKALNIMYACLLGSAWLGVSGVPGHVRSETKPAAARSAPWLGGATRQPRKNLLCQS